MTIAMQRDTKYLLGLLHRYFFRCLFSSKGIFLDVYLVANCGREGEKQGYLIFK
jgi:hypothetical protein